MAILFFLIFFQELITLVAGKVHSLLIIFLFITAQSGSIYYIHTHTFFCNCDFKKTFVGNKEWGGDLNH